MKILDQILKSKRERSSLRKFEIVQAIRELYIEYLIEDKANGSRFDNAILDALRSFGIAFIEKQRSGIAVKNGLGTTISFYSFQHYTEEQATEMANNFLEKEFPSSVDGNFNK